MLLDKFQHAFQDLEIQYPGLFQKKEDLLSYRWGCWLFQNGQFDDAKSKFRLSVRRASLTLSCILGLIGCYLKTNILCKNRNEALHLKRYANYLWSKGDKTVARRFYRKSLRQYALQATALKRIWGF